MPRSGGRHMLAEIILPDGAAARRRRQGREGGRTARLNSFVAGGGPAPSGRLSDRVRPAAFIMAKWYKTGGQPGRLLANVASFFALPSKFPFICLDCSHATPDLPLQKSETIGQRTKVAQRCCVVFCCFVCFLNVIAQ